METLKKEARYMVKRFQKPVLTDVMADESGIAVLYFDQEDEEWYKCVNENKKFFTSEAEAMNYTRSLIPSDMDKVKDYLNYIEYEEPEKLKEYLPEYIYNMYDQGRKATKYTYSEIAQMKEALAGNININACTFRKEQVSYIKWVSFNDKRKAKIVLNNGTTVCTNSEAEYEIIKAIFGFNQSGMSFTS